MLKLWIYFLLQKFNFDFNPDCIILMSLKMYTKFFNNDLQISNSNYIDSKFN